MTVPARSASALAIVVALIAALAGGALTVSAQSLGDVAKKEEKRRKAVKSSTKVYTNDDLGPGGTRPTPPAGETAGPGGSEGAPAAPQMPPAAPAEEEDEDPTRTEEYWRGRIAAARADLERNELLLEALQSRVNALSTDFVNRDDPAQRATIANDRQRALAELERVKETIEKLKQQILDIEEEARQAGVPPGWLR
jgi:hypothetical protein